jgi:hypothetical protein
VTNKFLTESDVFKDRLIGKAAQMLKEGTANKHGLVSIDDSAMTAPEIIETRNQSHPPVIAGKLMEKATGLNGNVNPI